ncbi:ras guanine nucleotide exchange factor domain-containing protein [Aspergillus cavernicola]|uniref:Ras guanine nucleotide exchange factor domain-containing protein n=1 Tax=Aspergillus cavernicola TaxID=176166 RepID=A0ABR4I263_9EURO
MGEQVKDERKDSGYSHVGHPENIIYNYNGTGDIEAVRAGSLTALVDHLTHPDKLDASFNRTFLTVYTYFTTSRELVQLLTQRYHCPPPGILDSIEAAEWSSQTKPLIRVRVMNVLKQWLGSFWAESKGLETYEALKQLQLFASGVTASESSTVQQQLLEIIQCRLAGVERMKRSQPSISNSPKPILPRKLKMEKLQFLKIDATEIARQLTLIESCMYGKLQRNELLHKNWQRKEQPAPNVRSLIQYFNQLSSWVGALILAESDLKKRTQVIGHLINVANICHELQNYSAVVSMLSGLESAPVYRLGRTWAMVTQRSCDILQPLQALISSDQNYQAYRDALRRAMPPCIPFLGLFLKDLVFIEDGNPGLTPEGLINFSKYSMLSSTIHGAHRFQEAPYSLRPVPELQEYLATQLQSAGDLHELWERSCQLEPKGRGDGNRERDMYTATGGMMTSMVVACMILDD